MTAVTIDFRGKGILLDIEGTTSSIRFVYDVLFPYARREALPFLSTRWDEPDVVAARGMLARDAGFQSFVQWQATKGPEPPVTWLCREAFRLMDADAKATGLKAIQGLIWREGFARGELRAHVYPDVPLALAMWDRLGLDVRIFSSGSVAAQRVFFAHTLAGDLSHHLKGYYDTTTGGKREPASYSRIAGDMGLSPRDVLFISDVPAELDAARTAGMATALAVRPENPDSSRVGGHAILKTLSDVVVMGPASARKL